MKKKYCDLNDKENKDNRYRCRTCLRWDLAGFIEFQNACLVDTVAEHFRFLATAPENCVQTLLILKSVLSQLSWNQVTGYFIWRVKGG